ncbi:unnamed protein product, partial [Dovyalis caffra]
MQQFNCSLNRHRCLSEKVFKQGTGKKPKKWGKIDPKKWNIHIPFQYIFFTDTMYMIVLMHSSINSVEMVSREQVKALRDVVHDNLLIQCAQEDGRWMLQGWKGRIVNASSASTPYRLVKLR